MTPSFARDDLIGRRWWHSHEEDTATETVYRPDSYHFRPSRGRYGFELKLDGTLLEMRIGPADRSIPAEGRWELQEGDTLIFSTFSGSGYHQMGTIVALDSERLALRR